MKVSIISGVYNVSGFLIEKSLSCIINQTYNDWELLLIDDGSTDGSSMICDEIAHKDNRIKVIHKTNEGLGSARNTGLDAATGDYIWFYDVDDEANLNLLDFCVKEMDSQQLDMLQFSFCAITASHNLKEDVILHEHLFEGPKQLIDGYLDYILFVKYGNGFAWNKVYRRSFLEKYKIRFENQRIQQDEVFNLKCYQKAKRIYLSPEILYNYYIYNIGNTRSRFIPDRFDIYVSVRDHFENLRKLWGISDSRFDDYLNQRFYNNMNDTLRFNLQHPDCQWNKNRRREEIDRVMAHPYSLSAIIYAKKQKLGFEHYLYIQALEHRSLGLLFFCSGLFSLLRRLKHMI